MYRQLHSAAAFPNPPEQLLRDEVFKVLKTIHLKEVVTLTLLFTSYFSSRNLIKIVSA